MVLSTEVRSARDLNVCNAVDEMEEHIIDQDIFKLNVAEEWKLDEAGGRPSQEAPDVAAARIVDVHDLVAAGGTEFVRAWEDMEVTVNSGAMNSVLDRDRGPLSSESTLRDNEQAVCI